MNLLSGGIVGDGIEAKYLLDTQPSLQAQPNFPVPPQPPPSPPFSVFTTQRH